MKDKVMKIWPLALGLVVLLLAMSVLVIVSNNRNQNHIVYSLDDAYIHMSMAKNLAQHSIWGVSRHEFASSSSSIIWTLLLSFIYLIFGVNEFVPMILNVIFGSLVIISSYYVLRRYNIKNIYIFLILILLIFVTPLPPLMFTGLEHVLHIGISILFVYLVTEELVLKKPNKKNSVYIILMALFLPLVRYEGIVLVMATSIIFLFRGRWLISILIFIFSLLPIFLFGIISVNNGWSFFPNSLLLRGNFPDVTSFNEFINFLGFLLNMFIPSKYFLLVTVNVGVIAIILFLAIRNRKNKVFNLKTTYMLLLFMVNVALYALYSKSGWSYRYQSFLVALGMVIISIAFFEHVFVNIKKYLLLKILLSVVCLLLPTIYFAFAGYELIKKTPISSSNIYEQQYQMGQFLRSYYQNKNIALNDIGASNYFADIKCLDLWGLSNLEISKKRRGGAFTDTDIREEAKKYDVDIAILYDSWFIEDDITILPKEWIKAGEWQIQNNVIAGDDVVSFYAVKPEEEMNLINNLKLYSKLLPSDVIQSGSYVGQ